MKKVEMKLLSSQEVNEIHVRRFGEIEGGFQRALRTRRIADMAKAFGNGCVCPPIVLGRDSGGLFVIDGQHRLEARKHADFPLYCVIVEVNNKQAAKNFIETNDRMVRVGLAHRLLVDPSQWATQIREFSDDFKISTRQVYNLFCGYARTNSSRQFDFEPADISYLRQNLKRWKDDPRWEDPGHMYSNSGILRVLGRLLYGQKNPEAIVKSLKKLDYSIGSHLSNVYGTSGRSQSLLLKYIHEKAGIKSFTVKNNEK